MKRAGYGRRQALFHKSVGLGIPTRRAVPGRRTLDPPRLTGVGPTGSCGPGRWFSPSRTAEHRRGRRGYAL